MSIAPHKSPLRMVAKPSLKGYACSKTVSPASFVFPDLYRRGLRPVRTKIGGSPLAQLLRMWGAQMQAELVKLEAEWLHAFQNGDSSTLDGLLDSAFVSSPLNAPDELLLRDADLREANRAQFRGCELMPTYVELIGNFAIVKCRIARQYEVKRRKWMVELSTTDIWVRREMDGRRSTGCIPWIQEFRRLGSMFDQDYVQKIIRAYMSISMMMNSNVLSPDSQRYFRDLSGNLEQEIATFKKEEPSRVDQAA